MRKKSKEIPTFNHERFFKFISISNDGCWNWCGFTHEGYGRFSVKKENGQWDSFQAHRVSYFIFNNSLDINLLLDHKCRNRKCVNPEHLREVDAETNLKENSINFIAKNIKKTQCPSGHGYTGTNTGISKIGGGYCKTCKTIKKRQHDARKKCL